MDVEARMTLCNMAAEFSAFTAIIAPDDRTLDYLRGRPYAPSGASWARAAAHWDTLKSDAGAAFDAEIAVDAAQVRPMVTWGTNPQHAIAIDARVPGFSELAGRDRREDYDRALAYMDLRPGEPLLGAPIDGAFIGACTNSRIGDLRRAAAVLDRPQGCAGRARDLRSGFVHRQARRRSRGPRRDLPASGFEWRESGCSMCFFAGGESFGPRQRVISSTNRNFESRQGPETFARISRARKPSPHPRSPGASPMPVVSAERPPEDASRSPGSPQSPQFCCATTSIPTRSSLRGKLPSVSKTGLAAGLFAGWRYSDQDRRDPDPAFVLNDPAYEHAEVLLAGENFGCGSSREHAVWALAEYGFRVVIAASFSPIFFRNCVRNGLVPAQLRMAELQEIARWVAEDPQTQSPDGGSRREDHRGRGSDRLWRIQIAEHARDRAVARPRMRSIRHCKCSARSLRFRDADRQKRSRGIYATAASRLVSGS